MAHTYGPHLWRKTRPYEIQSPLGAGGMGEVYRARDTRLDRIVAIKVLPKQFQSDSDLKVRFEREARAISSLQHALFARSSTSPSRRHRVPGDGIFGGRNPSRPSAERATSSGSGSYDCREIADASIKRTGMASFTGT